MRASLRSKKRALLSADNTQQDLFDHSVIAHTVGASSLCTRHAPTVKRCMMQARQARGLEIATNHPITQEGGVWTVPSQTSSKLYTVNINIHNHTCAALVAHSDM